MKRTIIIALAAICCITAVAKEPKRPTSYNYQRGLEALIQEENFPKALDYLNRELDDNPKCGYTQAWIASIRLQQEEYGRALTCVNLAIKYLPKNDKEYTSWAYSVRADIYANLEDTIAAIKDYSQAIKIDPSNYRYYQERADLYFFTKQYQLADADYQKIIKMDDNNAIIQGYMGLGRNQKEQGNYKEAIELFTKVVTLYGDSYSSSYSFRAECLLKLNRYEEAVSNIIKALDIDGDNKAYYMMLTLEDEEAKNIMQQKLRLQTLLNPNSPQWYYSAGIFAEVNKQYKTAIAYYQKENAIRPTAITDYRISSCYEDLGDYNSALKHINLAIEQDSTDADNYYYRANYYAELGQLDRSIDDMTKYIELNPRNDYGYYRRGWWEHMSGKHQEAIDDCELAIAIDSKYNYAYDCAARSYMHLGDTAKAITLYQKMLDFDTVPNNQSCVHFAYITLGENDKAVEWIEKILENDSTQYYDACCTYSLVGDTAKAFYYLEKALQDNFVRFHHLELDEDLINIRHLEHFEQLVNHYYQKMLENIEPAEENQSDNQRIVEVPFTTANGVTKVDCSINGLPLNFVFDTGASDVTISQVEANFMFKNGYLTGKDVIGQQRYQTADGNISVGTTINLNKINFCGLELTNVRASVVKSQNAPLLLGQSVLQRLGKIEIDNERRVLKITTR